MAILYMYHALQIIYISTLRENSSSVNYLMNKLIQLREIPAKFYWPNL